MAVSPARAVAGAVLGARVAYGIGLITAPERLARRWLGPAAGTGPVQVPLRALGMREVVLHAGALTALVRGEPLTPWLAGSVAGDLTDVLATVGGRRELPDGAAGATLAVGGGSAVITALVALATR